MPSRSHRTKRGASRRSAYSSSMQSDTTYVARPISRGGKVTIPFRVYNTVSASGVQSFFLNPYNVGLSAVSNLATVHSLYRFTQLNIRMYPQTNSGTPIISAWAFTHQVAPTAYSTTVAQMSQLPAFSLMGPIEASPRSLHLNARFLLGGGSRKWWFTSTNTANELSDLHQGLFYTYATASTCFYTISGVVEFMDPSATGYSLDSDSKGQGPVPTPVNPPDPESGVSPTTEARLIADYSAPSLSRGTSASTGAFVVEPPLQLGLQKPALRRQ
jgi:hypothetical protein